MMGLQQSTEDTVSNELWDEDLKINVPFAWNYKGYECIIRRHPSWKSYCGYTTIPETHPFYDKHYSNIEDRIDVHGGLTYSQSGMFGFDCCHLNDIQPGVETLYSKHPEMFDTNLNNPDAHYWTFNETKAEVEYMVDQFISYEEDYES